MFMKKTILIYPSEAAKLLGVSYGTFIKFRIKEGFPKARYPIGKRPMFLKTELEAWAKSLAT